MRFTSVGRYPVVCLVSLLMLCCGNGDDGEARLRSVALSFGEAYFNCRYVEAAEYVDDSSRRWLEYAASNMTQADVDLLRSAGHDAVVEVTEVVGDSAVRLRVTDFFCKDTIGSVGHYVGEATFVLSVVGDKVRMAGLPRSER